MIGKREESTIINGKNKSYTVIYMREIEVGLNNCKSINRAVKQHDLKSRKNRKGKGKLGVG